VSAALGGIRVLDLSRGIAGPLAAMLLADFGADVVKVEPPEGDPARALPGFAVWNRNKRGIVLPPGSPRLDAWLAGADVCVTSQLDPPVDPAALVARFPRLVVLHTPPYAPTHTPWAGGAESHALLAAMAGPARRQSSSNGGPIDLVYPFPLYVQGHWGAAATVAALLERQRSGFGQAVTVSGLHGVMVSCAGTFIVVPGQPALPTNVGPGGRHPCYTTYQCQDDEWLFLAALTPKFQVNAFKILGVGDVFADERIKGMPARVLLPENRGWVRHLLADAFLKRPRDEWLKRFEEGDCPAGPLGERDEWLDHPQLRANALCVDVDDPERGRVTMPGVPLIMTETPGGVRVAAPTLGQDNATAVPWPPCAAPSGAPTSSRTGPLSGYRVLDLGTILAGPYAGALLTELGADVIKVETPAGDAFRETGFTYNRGQRGLAINLTSPEAREAFYAVARTADAVLDNSRLGVLTRLGIDYASLKQVRPDIVTLSVNGFGEEGMLAIKPGFDPVLQAMSGMMTAQGGDCDPVLFTIPVNDITAATVAVFGVCLGLLHRERCGVGQRMWTSLLGCSAEMQNGELVRFDGRSAAVRGGCDFEGPSALNRFYTTRNGWLRLQAPNVAALQRAGLVDGSAAGLTEVQLHNRIARSLTSMTLAQALACLTSAGVPAAAARVPGDLPDDPDLQGLDMFVEQHMQDGTPFYVTHRYARFSRTQEQRVFTAPGIGEHSREVLADAGVEARRIDALIEAGAIKQGEPFKVVAIQNYR
jgi:crotonobetainyl-CoA:carnitine CoA-transferase CaiB-like acyl-CoA transferase